MTVMPTNVSSALRRYWSAIRVLVVLTVVLGVLYPLVVTGVAQLTLKHQANGSLLSSNGQVVGSSLIGQNFTDAKGNPLPEWFQPRPSAAGDGYDPTSTSASNLGPNNPHLLNQVEHRREAVAALDGVDPASVPADAVTASGSGLDPDISPAYARQQAARVAAARGLDVAQVLDLIDTHTNGRDLGFLGEPTVNVLELNLALQNLAG